MAAQNDIKIEIIFKSKSSKYSISNNSILIPIKLKRYGLSQVVNHLLSLDTPVPFDFIINEKFLAGSIESYLNSNGLSTENVLHVEFIELSLPPKKSSSLLHDDWISTVSINKDAPLILSGSFDGALRIWNEQGKVLNSLSLKDTSIKSSTWLNDEIALLGDSTSGIFAYSITSDTSDDLLPASSCTMKQLFKCTGHEGGITDIAVNADSSKFASASWDKSIRIWSSTTDDCTESDQIVKKSGKKQKVVRDLVKADEMTLLGHSGAVSTVLFDPNHQQSLFSGSWDHSVRLWDLERETNVFTLNCEKVVVSMSFCDDVKALVTGHEDGMLRLWDPRSRDGAIVKQKLSIHKNWISSLCPSPSQGFHISSSSYDGTVKVTDIRSTIPLYSLTPGDDASSKLYSLDWQRNLLITGGEDSKLHIYCPST